MPNAKEQKPVISEEQIRECVAQNLTYAQIAAKFGVSERCVARTKQRARLTQHSRPAPLSDEQMARAVALADEGMPSTWIAEDFGRRVEYMRDRLHPGQNTEWLAVWPSIRRNPTLYALHTEFAPRRG